MDVRPYVWDPPPMNQWPPYWTSPRSGRVIIALIISLSLGMVPLTLLLVKQALIDRAGETVALGAADIADKLDLVLRERAGDIQAFARPPLLITVEPAQIHAYLEELRRIYPMYRRLSVVDAAGRTIASTDQVAQGSTVVSPAMLDAALHRGGPHVDMIRQHDRPGGSLRAVRFAARLQRQRPPIQGILVSEIDQQTLRSFVTQTTQHEQRSSLNPEIQEFLVLSTAGDVLLTSEEEADGVGPGRPIGLPSAIMANEGKTGYVEETDGKRGRDALTGYAKMRGLPMAADLQWRILVRVDRTEVLHSIWSVLWKLVGIGSASLSPLLGLFYWARRRQSAEEAQAAIARQALEANEARIRKIVDIALDAVVIIDATGRVTEWNPQAEKTFGFARREAVGTPLTELIIPAASREAHMKGLQRYVSMGQQAILNRRIEINALHKDGHELPVELTVIPLHVGKQLSFCAFLRDITEHKRAEEELRGSKAFLDSVVDHLPTMVFIKDAKDLRFVRFNKAGEELIGCTQAELLGKSDYDLFPVEQADFFTRKDRAVLESGWLEDISEEPIQTKHKGTRVLHTKKIPIADASGRPQYLLGISEDITEQKQAADLLRRSQEAAEAANKAKSEFLANVSHEIRTPLNAILGTLDLLSDTATTTEQREYAAMGKRAGSVLLHLVNDLLDMAKVEAGTLRIDRQPVDLRELLRRAQSMMAPRAESKGLALRVAVDDAVPLRIVGDATRLQQILLNLIGNALKFTERGHVSCSVSLAPSERSDGGLLQVTVADSGIGIPADQFDTIFERFTQIDSGDNRKYGGTGLGLSICRQLVELMGGRMWVESEVGQGSRFLFTVPYEVAAHDADATAPLRQSSEGQIEQRVVPAVAPSDGPHILFVDDFRETLQLVKAFLHGLPYQLDLADNGEEALARCRLYRYDLVLMDMQMPGIDGYATTVAIRMWETGQGLPPVPIVAVTADVRGSAHQRSAASGCTDFLGKPFTKAALLDLIQRHTSEPHRRPARTKPVPVDQQDWQPLRESFLANRRRDMTVLTAALAAEDFPSIATVGHRIKGLAGSYGFEAIGWIAEALEQAARTGDRQAIEREIRRLEDALSDHRIEPGQAA